MRNGLQLQFNQNSALTGPLLIHSYISARLQPASQFVTSAFSTIVHYGDVSAAPFYFPTLCLPLALSFAP